MALQVRQMSLSDIKPFDNNPRFNNEAVILVAKSIQNFGFGVPIQVDKNNIIICGHTRFEAAKKIGLEKVPVIVRDDLTDEQVKAYRIADNKTAEYAQWDMNKLQVEVNELDNQGFDITSLGFFNEDLERILNGDMLADTPENDNTTGLSDADKVDDEELKTTDSKTGSIYQLGNHLLLCGNYTNAEHLNLLFNDLNDKKINLTFFDTLDFSDKDLSSFVSSVFQVYSDCVDNGAPYYLFANPKNEYKIRECISHYDFVQSSTLVFSQNKFITSFADYLQKHIAILYGWKNGSAHPWYGKHDDTTTTLQTWKQTNKHEMPLDMIRYFIHNSSKRHDLILDFTGNFGAVLMASEQTTRCCYCAESSNGKCDKIRSRWAKFVYGAECNWKEATPCIRTIS